MPKKCDKKAIMVKEGCNMIRRIVYENTDNKKFIKMRGSEIYLSDIRGKYRYSDK